MLPMSSAVPPAFESDEEGPIALSGSAVAARDVAPDAATLRWLRALEDPDTWLDTRNPERIAEFLLKLAGLAYDIGALPADLPLLVSWVPLNRLGPSPVLSCDLPPGRGAVSPQHGAYPWICAYREYDGAMQLGVGAITPRPDGASAVMSAHEAMSPRAAGDLLAGLGRESHAVQGFAAPASCRDAHALRQTMAHHLARRPALATTLARDFPLVTGIRPADLSAPLQAMRQRAKASALCARTSPAEDYILPAEVARVLAGPDLPSDVLSSTPVPVLAGRLKLSPTTLRLNLDYRGRLTVLGRQSERPDLVRNPWTAQAAERLRDPFYSTVTGLRYMQSNGDSIANALAARVVMPGGLSVAYCTGPDSDPG